MRLAGSGATQTPRACDHLLVNSELFAHLGRGVAVRFHTRFPLLWRNDGEELRRGGPPS